MQTPEEKSAYQKAYREAHKDAIKVYQATYRATHKEETKAYTEAIKDQKIIRNKEYHAAHKEEINTHKRAYKAANKNMRNAQQKARRDTDLIFKLRTDVSKAIHTALKAASGSKQGKSILDFLPYSIEELKCHLEQRFDPWMTWDNHGKYIFGTWNDNERSTWTWNIDHITPQSALPFASMQEDNFRKCWALENLRPYSAKQNLLDGNRH